jgi:hypothetical protein
MSDEENSESSEESDEPREIEVPDDYVDNLMKQFRK